MDQKVFNQKTNGDTVVPFLLNNDISGRFARIDKSLTEILKKHSYPYKVSCLLAEALLLTVMIGQAIKLRWKLSIQIRGLGAVKLITTDFYAPEKKGMNARVRAYAKFNREMVEKKSVDYFDLLGKGFFGVLIDQGSGTEPYQGITPLSGSSLSDCAQQYFDQSEQLPTTFKIFAGRSTTCYGKSEWCGGGIMLQRLADEMKGGTPMSTIIDSQNSSNVKDKQNILNKENENWSRAQMLLKTVEKFELVGKDIRPDVVLHRLFHEEELLIFDEQRLIFGCLCSKERVSTALSIYSSKDIKSMINEQGYVTADCQFCGKHYILNPNQLGFEAKK